jgi:lipopolysaccharide export system protein LptA
VSRIAYIFLLACCIGGFTASWAQTEKVIILEHADSLKGRVIDGEEARELIGHVQIRQENILIRCDRGLQMIRSGIVNLDGHVILSDDTVTITAPRAVYYRDDRRAEGLDSVTLDDGKSHLRARYGDYLVRSGRAFFAGDVVLQDSASTVTADTLTYLRPERVSIATGLVTVFSRTENLAMRGGNLYNDGRTSFSRMTVSPILVQWDTAAAGKRDTLIVRARALESVRDSVRRLIARDSVVITGTNLTATADRALFFTEGDSILLRGSPIVWYGVTQVTGDSVDVYLALRQLREVRVLGSAFAISQSDSLHPGRYHQLTGETLDLTFEKKIVKRIQAETRAVSVYYLYEDSVANGLNKSSGDRIVLLFEGGRLRSLKFIGGVEGQYVPEPVLAGREADYRLPGFVVRESPPRPPDKELAWITRAQVR